MIYTVESELSDFEFWSGAVDLANWLHMNHPEKWERIEEGLQGIFSDTPSKSEINDLFWFEPEIVLELAGLDLEEYENSEDD